MISSLKLLRLVALALGSVFGAVAAFAAFSLPSGQAGVAYSYTIVTNPAAPAGTVYGATGLPQGLSIGAASGVISGTPTESGVFTGVISLTDGAIVNNFDYSLTIAAALGTPEISSDLTALGAVGEAFVSFVTATNSPTSFNVAALPPGLSFDADENKIAGTPTTAGTYQVSLSANNASGTGAVVTLTITIEPSGPVPAITSAASVTANLNTAFSYQIVATNSPTSYSASGLPVGLTFNTASGEITGTPTVGGVSVATLTATNGNGTSANFSLTFILGPVAVMTNSEPVIGYAGYALAPYQLTATNSPLSFNVGALPSGLVYANGQITGTPASAGTSQFTASANNALGTGPSATLSIVIGTAVAPSFSQQPDSQTVNVGDSVTFSVEATGTPAPTFQWYKGDVAINGATTRTYTIPAAALADAGSYRVVATNLAGAVPSEFAELTVSAPVTGFASWSVDYFSEAELQNASLAGPNADPDGDGLSNLVEYALGLHPRQISTSGLPHIETTATHWTYTYTRPSDRSDVVYSVQASGNLSAWDAITPTHELIGTQNGMETWRASVLRSSAANLFFRLRVTRPTIAVDE